MLNSGDVVQFAVTRHSNRVSNPNKDREFADTVSRVFALDLGVATSKKIVQWLGEGAVPWLESLIKNNKTGNMWLDLNTDKAWIGRSASNIPLSPVFRSKTSEAPKPRTTMETKVEEMLIVLNRMDRE